MSVSQRKRSKTFRTWLVIALVIFQTLISIVMPSNAVPYGLSFGLGYRGVPFAGGAIVLASNFTNTGQLPTRIIGVTFTSDFWSNRTRQITSGLPFNLAAGMSSMVETPVLIPTSASIGDHAITGTVSWEYSNSSGWYTAGPVTTSTSVKVSQTLSTLLSSFVTSFVIGLGVVAATVTLVLARVMVRKRRRINHTAAPHPDPSNGQTGDNVRVEF